MAFWNFIRDIFTGSNSEGSKNERSVNHQDTCNRYNFRNPIWQNDEDEDDVDAFRHPRRGIHFQIFSDPLEMTRYFELQIDSMLKNFGFGFNNEGHNHFKNASPFISPQEENLRDKMLKSESDSFDQPTYAESKIDTDLDGKVTADNFSTIWNKHNKQNSFEVLIPHEHVIGTFNRKEYIQKSDGTVEQKQIFKDSEGNEETIISKHMGDKVYTVTIKRDKNGVETKSENFINMDESEVRRKNWLPSDNDNNFHNSGLNHFPWEKFFKPDPKL